MAEGALFGTVLRLAVLSLVAGFRGQDHGYGTEQADVATPRRNKAIKPGLREIQVP